MSVPPDYQAEFTRWCAERVPAAARASVQVAFRIQGDQVTFTERHPPVFPELDSAWTSTAVAQLRHNDPESGLWRIYRPVDDGWEPYDHPPATMPEPLLAEIAADPTAIFWG